MTDVFKWAFFIAVNATVSGFFGLGIALVHLLWLETATIQFPGVHYTDRHHAAFALACSAVSFAATLVRQIQTRLESKFLRPREIALMLLFIAIAMLCLTPVPGSNFPKFLYDANRPGISKTPGQAVPSAKH